MGTLDIKLANGNVSRETYYNVNNYPYHKMQYYPTCRKRKGKRSCTYINIPCAFDIESTTIYERNEKGDIIKQNAFMYQWQFCIDKYVCFGRRWEEFIELLERLQFELDLTPYRRLVIYVHNLSYEFQFFYRFIPITEIFATEKRKILYFVSNCFEFRCSYRLSNMSLAKFCENSELCQHYKLVDTYDYKKLRTPETPLTDEELAYCYNDVRGLCECIETLLQDDNLATIPYTNTGYVRRECRINMQKNPNNWELFQQLKMTLEVYKLCRKAFRGGNTHANRFFSNTIIDDCTSYDKQSSYPAQMLLGYYPMSEFIEITRFGRFGTYIDKFCCLIDITFYNIIINEGNVVPYIDIAHCYESSNITNDNGRVICADMVSIVLTEIDYQIIKNTYTFKFYEIHSLYTAERGKLPRELRESVLQFYDAKTKLKGVEGKEYEYMKSKNRLNGIFGMMVTDILHTVIEFDNGVWSEGEQNEETKLKKFYKSRNNFLAYQWGLWVTAGARKELQIMIDIVGTNLIYTDTDSIKYIGNYDKEFEARNHDIIRQCEESDIRAYSDRGDKRFYLGVWDFDGHYKRFKTLGAKKYCYDDDNGKFHVTVSGMNKKSGALAVGSIENFEIGRTYSDVGRSVSYYNDDEIHQETIDGCTFTSASNIAMIDTTYTLGVTNEYWNLISDNPEYFYGNEK